MKEHPGNRYAHPPHTHTCNNNNENWFHCGCTALRSILQLLVDSGQFENFRNQNIHQRFNYNHHCTCVQINIQWWCMQTMTVNNRTPMSACARMCGNCSVMIIFVAVFQHSLSFLFSLVYGVGLLCVCMYVCVWGGGGVATDYSKTKPELELLCVWYFIHKAVLQTGGKFLKQ